MNKDIPNNLIIGQVIVIGLASLIALLGRLI